MAEKKKTSELKVDVKASVIRSADVRVPSLPPALLTEIADLLELPDQQRAAAHFRLKWLASNYSVWKSLLADSPVPSQSKKLIIKIPAKLNDALSNLDRLPPELAVALDLALEKHPNASANPSSLIGVAAAMKQLRDAASWVADGYKPPPGRPASHILEMTVGALMFLMESWTGNRAKVSQTDTGEYSPRLTSPEAKAIGRLLLATDPELEQVTIVNKIEVIERRYRGKPLPAKYRQMAMMAAVTSVTPF